LVNVSLKKSPSDYKNVQLLRNFITRSGKVIPRRVSGLSAKQQRQQVTRAIRRARNIALLPLTEQL
jgi:small subunit ribosomal protein S18